MSLHSFVVMNDDLGQSDLAKYVGLTGIAVSRSRVKYHWDDELRIMRKEGRRGYDLAQHNFAYDYALCVTLYQPTKNGIQTVDLKLPEACFTRPLV